MAEKSSWEAFFDAHAPVYETNVFTKNTVREVDFLLEELSLQQGASILDVGCGTGRHSIELAKRGFAVTGLDLSSEMLARAAAAAKAASVNVNWIIRMPPGSRFPGCSIVRFACVRELSGCLASRMIRSVSLCPSCAISHEP